MRGGGYLRGLKSPQSSPMTISHIKTLISKYVISLPKIYILHILQSPLCTLIINAAERRPNSGHPSQNLTSCTVLSWVECKMFQYNHFSQMHFMQYFKQLTQGGNKPDTTV